MGIMAFYKIIGLIQNQNEPVNSCVEFIDGAKKERGPRN